MATLQKIRNRGILLAVIIGLALLAFIVGDFLKSGSSLFQQSKQSVGEVDGEKINIMDYQKAIDQMNKIYQIEFGRNDFNEEETAQIRNAVWENIVNTKLLQLEAEKIGLTVGKEELEDRLIGNNIHPLIQQRRVFADPQTGQFSRNYLLQFYENVFSNDIAGQDPNQLNDAKDYWLFWENEVKNAILQEKFAALLSKSVSANGIEGKYNFDARNQSADINYIVQPYYTIPDSTISVSDADIKEKYNKNKELYKQEANRTIKYVSFEVVPLEADFQEAQKWMDNLQEEFKTTNDPIALVNQESDISYNGQSYSKQTIPNNLKDFAFSNPKGAIYGPTFDNNTHLMARIIETGIMESDSINLRHIVLNPKDSKQADSLFNALQKGANFAEAAKKHSLAQQTANNGGEIGWITRNGLDKEILTVFSKNKNELVKIANSQGIQIFQVIDKTTPRAKVKVAILERKVTPSNQSYSIIYNQAKQFAVTGNTDEKFEKVANEKGYIIRPAENLLSNTQFINRIPQSRQVVKWAFEGNKGDVSDVFDCDRQAFVVANITEINKKGYRSIEQVKEQLKSQVIRDKKAVAMEERIAQQIQKTPTLEGLATAMNLEIKNAPMVNFSSFQFGEAGMEAYIIGTASAMPQGKVSAPLKGEAGVYVIQPISLTKDSTTYDQKLEIEQLNSRTAQTLPYIVLQKLKEKYDVIDNRARFY